MKRLIQVFHFVSLLALLLSLNPVLAETFSIEQIMSSPFPSGMTAAPVDGKVAWVMNQAGARNIWVAGPPDYKGRQLTKWIEDDGQTITQLNWAPDATKIFFVRGDGPNSRGEFPNPLHLSGGAEQAIWALDVSNGNSEKITTGTSPLVTPNGMLLAFLRDGQIWLMQLQNDKQEPKPLVKSRGRSGSLSWSPDGLKLAFVSSRGDHSFIGVYSMENTSVRFLDPSVDRDSNPVWSSDSRELAFMRIPSSRDLYIFSPKRDALPWSIRIVDVNSGRARQVWRADPGRGSVFRNIVGSSQLLWSPDGQLVFPWEKDGWTHLYSVSDQGGKATLLTPGEFDVEDVILNHDGSIVIFSSNQDDIDRRHLWAVTARGGSPVALTAGRSNEWRPTPLSDGKQIAFIGSTGRQPAQPAILETGSEPRPLAAGSLPADFPVDQLVEPQQVVFSSADGMEIHGQLFLPPDHEPGDRHPAMLYFHGGSRRQMILGWHYSSYYHNCYALNQYLASQGYVVMSVNYRSGIMYGMEFREALNYGAQGASEFNDVLGAGVYLRSRGDVDPSRIGLWGGSYGGYLTALGLARASDLFAAGVDVHGVHDWNVVIRNFVPSYDPAAREKAAALAYDSSPMSSMDTWRSPVLLIHGDDDRNVPFSESVDLAEELRKRDIYFEQVIFPDEVHGFLMHRSWLKAFEAASDFLERRLTR